MPAAEIPTPLFGDEHVRRYRDTDGREGHEWRGAHTLLLTTTGRRSRAQRTTPLIYGRDGKAYVVVASKGGAPEHPAWYLNLDAHPEVDVQVEADRFPARARTAAADERSRLWAVMVREWSAYATYATKTDREIPVVILERA